MRKKLWIACLAAAAFSLTGAMAQEPKPDNTKVNKQDRMAGAVTADQAKNNKSDTRLAQQIRKAIVKDKGLSTYAHNVKVVVQNGAVTLRGPVRSDDEKRAVEAKATSVAGSATVTNELTIAESADRAKSK